MTRFYWLVGSLIVTNIGTIGAVLWAAFRGVWWLSKLDARVSENTDDINEAHKKIRYLEKRAMDGH